MDSTIGMRIKQLREAKQMSVADFAKAAGVKPSAIYGLEGGANKPSIETVAMLRKSFPDLNTEWLQFGDGSMYKGAELTPTPPTDSTPSVKTEPDSAPAATVPSLNTVPVRKLNPHMDVVRPTYEELLAENTSLHKRLDEKDAVIADLRTDKGQLWQQNTRLIELGKDDASPDAAAPATPFAWLPEPHRQVTGLVRYDQPETACAHYDLATGLRVEKLQVAKAA